jgi:hypothetical protein
MLEAIHLGETPAQLSLTEFGFWKTVKPKEVISVDLKKKHRRFFLFAHGSHILNAGPNAGSILQRAQLTD